MHPNEAIFISTSCISGIKTAAFTCALRTRRPAGIQPPSLHFQHARSSVYDPMGFPRFCSNVTKFKSTYSCPPKASFKKKKEKAVEEPHGALRPGPGSLLPRKDAQPKPGLSFSAVGLVSSPLISAELLVSLPPHSAQTRVKTPGHREVK